MKERDLLQTRKDLKHIREQNNILTGQIQKQQEKV